MFFFLFEDGLCDSAAHYLTVVVVVFGIWHSKRSLQAFRSVGWRCGEGPSYNQPRNLPRLSVSSKTPNPSHVHGYGFMSDPALWPPTSLWRGTRTNFTREDHKKKRISRKGRGHFQERLRALFLFSLTLKSGQTKVSLKKFPQGTMEVRFLKWNPACQPLQPVYHYLHRGFVVVSRQKKTTAVLSSGYTRQNLISPLKKKKFKKVCALFLVPLCLFLPSTLVKLFWCGES